jgi:hypothetical protein
MLLLAVADILSFCQVLGLGTHAASAAVDSASVRLRVGSPLREGWREATWSM